MQHFKHGDVTFNAHSDLSGDVIIRRVGEEPYLVPGEALLAFVADFVARRKISAIESATPEEVLGL